MNTEYMVTVCRHPRQKPVNALPIEKVNRISTHSDLLSLKGNFQSEKSRTG